MSNVQVIKPIPKYAPPVPYQGNPPVVRDWIAPNNAANHSASLATNWSPTGVPQPGDTLVMQSGQMDISGNDLQGDLVFAGVQNQATALTLNLSHQAQVTLEPVKDANPDVTINVGANDVGYVNILDGGFESNTNFTFALSSGSSIQSNHFDLTLSTASLSGGIGFLNTGEVTLHQSNFYVHNDLEGTGQITVGDAQLGQALATFDKTVSSGQTIDVTGSKTVDMNSSIDINDPTGFAAQVNLNFASLVLTGVHADSYSLQNDLLSMFSKGAVVDTVRLTSSGSTDPLKVFQTSAGVLVDNSNHGAGTLLPLHV